MMIKLATIMGIILISVCGWVALVGLVLTDNIWVGSVLSIAGGGVIGGAVAYLLRRWWFKGIPTGVARRLKGGG